MKKLGLLALISAIFTIQAAENQYYQLVDTLSDSSFFKQTHVDLTLRNYWKYLKENEAQPKEVHNAWGQAFGINYQSGYLLDIIGFDATYTGVVKFGASDYFTTRALLYNDGKGFDKHNAKGFSKIGTRYAKIKLGNDALTFNGKYGWQVLTNYGVLTTSYRLSENTYLGYSGTLSYQHLSLDSAYVTSAINRDSPDKTVFQTRDSRNIDHILTAGLTYKDNDLYVSYSYGEAKDYQRRHIIEASYKPIENLTLGTQIYGSYALDNYKKMSLSRKEFNDHAWHYAADAKWQQLDWSIKLGIAYTQAEKENGEGYYERNLTQNMRGRFNALTSAGADYMRDGELALTAVGTYKFIDELTTGLQINYGQFDYQHKTIRTGEISLFNIWQPQDPRLKDLSIFSMFGYGWSYKQNNKVPTFKSNGDYQHSPNLSGEVIIQYRFNLL